MTRYFKVYKKYTNVTDYYKCVDNDKAQIYNKKRGWWDTTIIPNAEAVVGCARRYPENYILTEITPDEFKSTLIMEELIS